jgi:hypothetical protein
LLDQPNASESAVPCAVRRCPGVASHLRAWSCSPCPEG